MRRRSSGVLAALALLGGLIVLPAAYAAAPTGVVAIASVAETTPVTHSGDAADDPAIWVDRADPARSLVIGNDKGGALETYDLSGALVQRITSPAGKWGNVDVRQGVDVAGVRTDVVAAVNGGIRFFAVDPVSRRLRPITDGTGVVASSGEGLCLYQAGEQLSAFLVLASGAVRQYAVGDADHDGLLEGTLVRTLQVGGKAEGCAVDDVSGALYVAQEDTAIWRYGADAGSGAARTQVDAVVAGGGHLTPDIEGLTTARRADGRGVLIASAQNGAARSSSYFTVYDLDGNGYLGSFRVTSGATSDDCDGTDGVAAYAGSLGPAFPDGLFVCQDNSNAGPGTSGNQDFKYAPMTRVLAMLPAAGPPAGGTDPVSFVGVSSAAGSGASGRVTLPSVRAGDTLVLFASTGAGSITPPAGWRAAGTQSAAPLLTGLYTRTATSADSRTVVRVSFGGRAKYGLVVAAYRGLDPSAPLAAVASGAAGAGTTRTTPRVSTATSGWVVSYWSDRSSAVTGWSAPSSGVGRAVLLGSGGGRITALLADSAAPVSGATVGGVSATSNARAPHATVWTLVLRP